MNEPFRFGENWRRFLDLVDESRIAKAEQSLLDMLHLEHLRDRTFLDVGTGSGLFSLAAVRLGATRVHSFDADAACVACAQELKRRFAPGETRWSMTQGNVLDASFLAPLGTWDVVYAWGVLHHTGELRKALEQVIPLVKTGGRLVVSIYNDQGAVSRAWRFVKQAYNRAPGIVRRVMEAALVFRFSAAWLLTDLWHRRNPLRRYRQRDRGMSVYRDVVDWLGGLPFEVASPESVFRFYRDRGFVLCELKTVGGYSGCNEFVFMKSDRPAQPGTPACLPSTG